MKNPLKVIYNKVALMKYNFWLWFWYKLTRCPICHQKIYWKHEYGDVWDEEGYYVAYHVKKGQDDICEGVC